MKKFLVVFSLAALATLGACKGNSNTNVNTNANANTNTNAVVVSTATPTPAAATSADKTKIEEALKKAGFTTVTVDTTTTPATIRGTVAKGKLAEVVKTAQEAAGKPVKNEVTEK